MPLVTTQELVAAAAAGGTGVAAFNVVTLEHAEGIAAGAERAGRPAILQVSQNAVRYHGGLRPIAVAARAVAEAAHVALSLHLDHVEDEELLHECPSAGFSSVMVDASHLDDDANLVATRRAADWAHRHGLFVEAELGQVGGKDGAPGATTRATSAHDPGARTDPGDATRYVAETGVDALAVAVGSSHAMTSRTASLDLSLVSALRDAVPVPLVLHGSSGVPDDVLAAAVGAGITKVNVGTLLNTAWTGAVRAALADEALVDPRRYLAPARDAVADVVAGVLGVVSR